MGTLATRRINSYLKQPVDTIPASLVQAYNTATTTVGAHRHALLLFRSFGKVVGRGLV